MSGARLLALDTATEALAVALRGPRGDAVVNAVGGAQASMTLVPTVRRLLAEAGLAFADIDAVGYGAGPGAFTGLRTSCAVAQGFGAALDRPLLAVDSLLIVADDALDTDDGDVVVVMDARMDEAYAGRYRRHGGRWQTVVAPALHALSTLPALWHDAPPDTIAGSALAAFADRLALPAGMRRVVAETDRAAALLRLTQAAYDDGAGIDAAAALPLYLRDKVALTTAERAAARAR